MTAAGESTPVFFNPFDPEYPANPYPHFAELREHDPIHESLAGPWIVFRYDDVFRLLRHPELSVEDRHVAANARTEMFDEILAERGQESRTRGNRSILNIDPPDHTRLRRLVSKAFTPRTIEGLRPVVEGLVDDALDRAEAEGGMELIGDLAFPLPFTVISEMLGMPDSDRDELRDWSHAIVKTLDPVISEEEIIAALDASDAMAAHLDDVIAWKRQHPGDDVLTALIHAEEDGDVLTTDQLQQQVALLFIAGHETTVNLIGNGTLALLRNRRELERWRDDPTLDANAVDELLRYDSPVQFSRRITVEDTEFGDRVIPGGSFVLAGLASANRDPDRWGATADDLDLGRAGAPQHLAFGSGVHFCLGAALARLEGQAAIGRLIRRFPELDIADPGPAWNGRLNLRGLDRLPLALS
ncbi:MAG TPA: cytochrome P450 [Acidimicrobiales bacterium]|nr:cytochrome P450 [Acidimicrobiales bacterium]